MPLKWKTKLRGGQAGSHWGCARGEGEQGAGSRGELDTPALATAPGSVAFRMLHLVQSRWYRDKTAFFFFFFSLFCPPHGIWSSQARDQIRATET